MRTSANEELGTLAENNPLTQRGRQVKMGDDQENCSPYERWHGYGGRRWWCVRAHGNPCSDVVQMIVCSECQSVHQQNPQQIMLSACGIRLCKLCESQIEDVLVVSVASDRTTGKRVFWLMLSEIFGNRPACLQFVPHGVVPTALTIGRHKLRRLETTTASGSTILHVLANGFRTSDWVAK